MAFIEIDNVWKNYGRQVVLERLSKTVKAGEFVTIVGASGCGKSTFLNMLLGTETPTRGEIRLDGRPICPEPGPDRGIVFQKYSAFPHLSVLQNVVLSLDLGSRSLLGRLVGKRGRQSRKDAMKILEAVGLVDAADKYPYELSGGMQQRLAIAQALIKRPAVLLLDEPFAALDPGIRAEMHQLVLDLWREYKLTVFMITHDLKEGFYLGTRLWVFDKLRHDPQAPEAYGAGITYDLPVGHAEDRTLQSQPAIIFPTGADLTLARETL